MANGNNNYSVAHLKYSHSETRLGVGSILQCNKGDTFGMVYGYREHNRRESRGKTWIYYFKKSKNLSYDKHLAVSFLKSSSGYNESESYEVSDITPLEKYRIYSFKENTNKKKSKKRSDGIYHNDDEWNVMCEGKPYIELDNCSIRAYYPVIDKTKKTIVYHDYWAFSRGERTNNILTCFIGMYDLKQYSTEPTFEFVSSKLDEIKQYIENFNLNSNIRLFIAGQSGRFVNYPGRDDSFFITDYRRTNTKDSYMKQLVELYEKTDYWNCNGRDGDDYDRIDEEETLLLRKEVKQKYDKNCHYMFLLNEFLDNMKEQRELYLLFADDIHNLIEVDDYSLFQSQYDEKEYIDLVERYNKKHDDRYRY